MATLIGLSIDVSKIDKSKLVNDKYLNITVSVDDETGAYGNNVSAYHEQTKEQREAKTNKFYVGNGRTVWTDGKIQAFEYKKDSGQERKSESDKQADETDLAF